MIRLAVCFLWLIKIGAVKKCKMFRGKGAETMALYLSSASEISLTWRVLRWTRRCLR